MNIENLEQYAAAWNDHDIDKIMGYMSEDCIFRSGGGSERYGAEYRGHAAVRERFESIWADLPDASFTKARHFIDGNRGCSEWTFVATSGEGKKLEIDGCDLFTFRDGKIALKNTFLKNRQ